MVAAEEEEEAAAAEAEEGTHGMAGDVMEKEGIEASIKEEVDEKNLKIVQRVNPATKAAQNLRVDPGLEILLPKKQKALVRKEMHLLTRRTATDVVGAINPKAETAQIHTLPRNHKNH